MVINIRPEIPLEYEEVNKVIYSAFSEQYGVEMGKFMMEHFIEERKKRQFRPRTFNCCRFRRWNNYRRSGIT
jgi:hypothetical protein